MYLPENDFIVGKPFFWECVDGGTIIEIAILLKMRWPILMNGYLKYHRPEGGSLKFIDNVTNKSEEQHRDLIKKLEYYEGNSDVENIVIVTHTVPLEEFALEADGNTETSCQLQSFSKDLVDGRYKKLKTWIFGHTHNQFDKTINNVRFLTNPLTDQRF